MNGQPTPPFPRVQNSRGFTLTELMVVITILAILASIAIPATQGVLNRAHQAAAKNSATQLKTAIATYFTEYRRYPTRLSPPEEASNPILSDHLLMDILLASQEEQKPGGLNTRRHVTFTDRKARPVGDGTYRYGLRLEDDGGGTLWDPWGEHYRVVLDLNYDGRVPAPDFVTDASFLSGGTIVWSAGKARDDAEAKDNVVTW